MTTCDVNLYFLLSIFSFHFFFFIVLGLGPASSDIQYLIGFNHGSFVVEKHRFVTRRVRISLISSFLFPGATGWHDA